MLEIQEVEWRNFLSYGDYDNSINLSDLGQCLITGEVSGDEKGVFADSPVTNIKKSNGAGKSTIPNAILWTLFGRTMHHHNPGDRVVNWFTGKDCRCRVLFKNGDEVVRTRNTDGHNELMFIKDGDQSTYTSDTLSTTKVQQAELDRVFGLDWELFCGSVFFNQYSKPWMEMADQTRKKAMERALHVDRFAYRAKVAKGKCDKIDADVRDKRQQIENTEAEVGRLNQEITRLTETSSGFTANQKERQTAALKKAVVEKQERDAIERPDVGSLEKKWSVVQTVQARIDGMEEQVRLLNRQIASLEGLETQLKQKIKTWETKAGKMCGVCEQEVPATHTAAKVEPIQTELAETQGNLKGKKAELDELIGKIGKVKRILAEKKPDQTVRAAKEIHTQWGRHDGEVTRLKSLAKSIGAEENPHDKSIADAKLRFEDAQTQLKALKEEIERVELLNKHYHYIYKAWNDRTKIKSFVFQDHIPYINTRLKHYLDIFGLDVPIEITSSLGISSDLWGYEFESGGERKRTDVAFMLAMFDFHEAMYGRQCNILVLDEVDGRLDDDGIDSLIGIINNDLAPKVESIIVISHRNMMHDTFPRELRVKRVSVDGFRGFSQLEVA
jgi:DNA repair exonuclease SbcCD ATPase subunit